MVPSSQQTQLTSSEEFTIWGLAQSGPMRSARPKGFKTATGEAGIDEMALVANHIERFFAETDLPGLRELARHVYVFGLELDSYSVARPGESLLSGLIRHGAAYLMSESRHRLAQHLHDQLLQLHSEWKTGQGRGEGEPGPRR